MPHLARPGCLLGLLNLGLGLVLVLGGPLRTSSPSFAMVRDVMSIHKWGVAFLVGGLVCWAAGSLGRRGAVLVALGAGVHFFWAAALTQAVLDDQRAALTGVIVYSWTTLTHVITGVRLARRVS